MIYSYLSIAHTKERIALLNHAPGITPLMVSEPTLTPPKRTISALFIGNSYTFSNNMPRMLIDIANADPRNDAILQIQATTFASATLKQHWKGGDAPRLLKNTKWNFAILQEQSLWAMYVHDIVNTRAYIYRFTALANAQGTIPLWLRTWPRKPDSAWYRGPDAPRLKNADYMYKKTYTETQKIAQEFNVEIIPVADYWMLNAQDEGSDLYSHDATHPSRAGSYLSALIVYRYITGNSPLNTTYKPYGVSEENAETLRKTAASGDLPTR
tara:strand:+ start:11909 stop:12715 length:807 start_codon:yes stop_codon:yes gene_type:complete